MNIIEHSKQCDFGSRLDLYLKVVGTLNMTLYVMVMNF